MNANLYLHTNSIRWNGVDNEYEILSKLSKLTVDLISFKNNSKNTHHNIKVSPQIYEVDICKSKKIIEIIEGLQREEKNYIYSILGNTSEECDLSYEELETKSMYDPGETECNAILFLNHNKTNISINPYMTFDRYQIIYNTQTLMVLYRQILGNHPGDAIHFMGECHICFPNIYFHVHCNDSIIDYLNRIPRKIVCHLACMNDCLLNFIKEKETGKDANTVLEEFAGCYGLETGSLQRNIKSKDKLTYEFPQTDDNTKQEKVYCEPHFKIDHYDDNYVKSPKDSEDNFRARIYFHFGLKDVADGKILVGSIGPHV